MAPTLHHDAGAVLHRVLADLARRHIIQWRHPPGAHDTPLGPVVCYGGIGSADMLVVLAPYGYVLALTGTDTGGTLTRAQRALLDTITAAGIVALVVYPQPWCHLLDQGTDGRAVQQEAWYGTNGTM